MKKITPIVPDDEEPIEASQEKIEELAETAEQQLKKPASKKIEIKSFDKEEETPAADDKADDSGVGNESSGAEGIESPTEELEEKSDEPAEPEESEPEAVESEESGTDSKIEVENDGPDLDQDSEATEAEPEQPEEDEVIELDEDGKPAEEAGDSESVGVDADLDAKVDDIVRQESDELLDSEDKELAEAFQPEQKLSFGAKVKNFFKAWVRNPKARWATFAAVVIIAAAVAIIPAGRYFALNLLGVRSKASLTVRDDRTQQPLRNVLVSLAGQEAKTDKEGRVSFRELRLGPTQLKLEKRAFATVTKKLTVGWGSNPLGEYKITATGTLYTVSVRDWLSDKPLEKVEATSGEASALSDSTGKIVLAIDTDEDTVKINLHINGYRQEALTITENDKTQQTVKMVPARKHIFVSKRTGKFDIYKIDVDGKNERLLLAATGLEREDMTLAPQQDGTVAALVATRENARNKDNFLLSGLYIIDIDSGKLEKIGRSERVQVVGWIGDRLVYVLVSEGVSDSNPRRHKLVSYHYKEGTTKELAYANYFNDVLIAGGKIYYAPSNAFLDNNAEARLYSLNADGSEKQTILDKESWNVFRTAYDTLSISSGGKEWFTHILGSGSANRTQTAPSQLKSRIYIDNFDRSRALWIDERDGKGVLLEYALKTRSDKILSQQIGLNYPAYWLGNTYIVFRVAGNQETADYVISTRGGQAKKIKDVSNTGGVDSWYYYQ